MPGKIHSALDDAKSLSPWGNSPFRHQDQPPVRHAVRLQLHALAYNLANFLRTLALPEAVSHWSMTTLRDRLVKIGAKIVRHGRSITFQMAEVMVPRGLFSRYSTPSRRSGRCRPPEVKGSAPDPGDPAGGWRRAS